MFDLFPSDHSKNSLLSAQKLAAERAVIRDDFAPIKLIAGADQAFAGDMMLSGIVVLDYPSLEIAERVFSIEQVIFPYMPTFLSFREGPAIMSAFEKLKNRPDILMVDGAGINHPRRAGIATHVGVALDVPTIGITKKLLCGSGEEPVDTGEAVPLSFEGRQVGWMLRSSKRSRAIFVTPGHRVSLDNAFFHKVQPIRKTLPCFQAHLEHFYAGIDGTGIFYHLICICIYSLCYIYLIYDNQVCRTEYQRMLFDNVVPLANTYDHYSFVFAKFVISRADEVAHVLDEQQVKGIKWQVAQTMLYQMGIEMALFSCVKSHGRNAVFFEPRCINACDHVPGNGAYPETIAEFLYRLLYQQRFSRADGTHYVECCHAMSFKRIAVAAGYSGVHFKDIVSYSYFFGRMHDHIILIFEIKRKAEMLVALFSRLVW